MNYGKRIRQIREEKGIKACYVAERIGMTPSGYSGIEKGRTKLTVDKALKIAKALDVDLNEIFFEPHLSETHNHKTKLESA